MADSNATYTRTISVDLPDYVSQDIEFRLRSVVAIAGSETFPPKTYTLTLDASGTGTIDLPTPDNTGDASWLWEVKLPDGTAKQATLAYAGSTLTLAAWLASAASTETANSIADQFVAVAGDTMTGALILSGDPTTALGAATKQYADAAAAGVTSIDDVGDVTVTGTPADDEVLAYDTGSGEWINQTAAEASLAAASHNHAAGDVTSGTFADARIAESNVTQHEAALSITESQISDLDHDTNEYIILAVSDETSDLTTGTAKVTFRMPYALTLSEVRASVTTAPTGSALQVDINESGTTILSTKLTIDAGEKTSETAATPAVISDSALADDAEITIDIDSVGSTVAGAGLKVYLIGAR